MALLGSPSLIVLDSLCGSKATLNLNLLAAPDFGLSSLSGAPLKLPALFSCGGRVEGGPAEGERR